MIVVTGGTGHIGNVLVRELVHQGKSVRVVVLPGDDLSPLKGLNVEIIEGNILDVHSLKNAFTGADVVFHLAGMISILPGQREKLLQINVLGTKNVIQVCKEVGVKRLVYTSSIHALTHVPEGITIDESASFGKGDNQMMGDYDFSKALATIEVIKAAQEGLDAVVVCPTGVIGPYDYKESELGQLIHSCTKSSVQFYPDGAYDFVDVRDVARGHILAENNGVSGEAYILSGERITIKEIYELVKEITSLKPLFVHVPYALTWMAARIMPFFYKLFRKKPKFTPYSIQTVRSNSWISSKKAQIHLGYSPRPIKETMRDTIEWLRGRELATVKRPIDEEKPEQIR
jgi:dihydroflavonol-4-reductase